MITGRLALRQDAYWVVSADGFHAFTNRGPVALGGAPIGTWVERLAPLLNGERTLAELTADLAPERRVLVERIVTLLAERGVLRETGDDESSSSGAGALDRYRAELAFVGWFRSSPARAFARHRGGSALVVGAGRLLAPVVGAGLRSGLRQVRTVVTSECPTDLEALEGEAERGRAGEPDQRCDWTLGGTAWADAAAVLLEDVDAVLHVSDQPMAARAGLLEALCAQHGIPVAHALTDGDEVWCVPTGRVGVDRPAWAAGWMRRAGFARSRQVPGPRASADAAVVANQFVHDLLRFATGVRPPARRPQMTRIDMEDLRTSVHAFLPHPYASIPAQEEEGQFLARLAELDAGPGLTEQEFSQRATALVDGRLGVFGEMTEGDFAQLPLHVTQISLADPVGLGPRGGAPTLVTGAGPDFASARYRAVLRALAVYCSRMVDPRRLHDRGGAALAPRGSDPRETLDALRAGRLDAQVHSLDLAHGRVRPLPAQHAFPALRGGSTSPMPPCGSAAAYSWPKAVAAGLLAHCRRLTVEEALASPVGFPPVDPATVPADPVIERLLLLLAAVGEPFAIHDVTGTLGVPTFAFSLAGRTVAYCAAASAADALRDGLEQMLLSYQSRAHLQPAYAPTPVPALPARPAVGCEESVRSGPSLDVTTLVERLRRRGHTPLVVALDHDPAVHLALPAVVQVVVTDDLR